MITPDVSGAVIVLCIVRAATSTLSTRLMDGSQAHWNALRGRHLWREFRVLRSVTADVIPGSLRTHKNVHRYLDAWIAVYGSKSHPMHLSFVCSA
jgi:hypothetical protein